MQLCTVAMHPLTGEQGEEFSNSLSTSAPQEAVESNEVVPHPKNISLFSFYAIIFSSLTIVFLMFMFVIIPVPYRLVTFTETLVCSLMSCQMKSLLCHHSPKSVLS